MSATRLSRLLALGLCLVGLGLFVGGCASTEPDNLSERPWNTPQQWENGLPPEMFEGR